MMRDYTDMMHMAPDELVRHALDCAKFGIVSIALVEALAVQLETQSAAADEWQSAAADELKHLKSDLADAELRADMWRDEAHAIQRQLDMVRG